MEIEKVSLQSKFQQFTDHWSPKIVGELNQQHVKLVKFKGQFTWHKHDNEDEMFYVFEGSFKMHLRDKTVELVKGDFIIIPKGVEHMPEAEAEVHILLFEPATTLNTGDQVNNFTKKVLEKL